MQNIASVQAVIALLRVTKKTDPSFKALKKLKQALEVTISEKDNRHLSGVSVTNNESGRISFWIGQPTRQIIYYSYTAFLFLPHYTRTIIYLSLIPAFALCH